MNAIYLSAIVNFLNSFGFEYVKLTESSYDVTSQGTKLGNMMIFKGELRFSNEDLEGIVRSMIELP